VGGRRRIVTPEQEARAIEMLRAGNSVPAVAKALGVSKSLIYQRARDEWAPRISEGAGK
jgi:transposase-like protein